jgi:RHS repeat-associated protein
VRRLLLVVALCVGLLGLRPGGVAEAAGLPPLPGAPSPVVPAAAFSVVTTPGPTAVSGSLAQDTVWGPEGSPYVVSGNFFVSNEVSLTLLPGTVVKMESGAKLNVNGQLLSLGTPDDRVTITGSTAGRGQWRSVDFPSNSSRPYRPASVIAYTDISGGGETLGTGCINSEAMLYVDQSARVMVSESSFTEAKGVAVRAAPYNSYFGLYDSRFADSGCGLHLIRGDIVGNSFEGGFDQAALFVANESVPARFWHNTVVGTVQVNTTGGSEVAPVSFMYNDLSGADVDRGAAAFQNNWWGYTIPPSPPSTCIDDDVIAEMQPPVYAHRDQELCDEGYLEESVPYAWAVGVYPSLSGAPGGLPEAVTRPYAPKYGPVDTYRGVLTYSATDLVVNDAGATITAARNYSSSAARDAAPDDVGRGWRTSYSEGLATSGSSAAITLSDDGVIPLAGDGGVPAGVVADYATSAAGSTVTTGDNTTYEFDPAGELTGMVLGDPGHELDIDRAGGKVSKVAGVSDRYVEFNRTGGRVMSVGDSQNRSVVFDYDTEGRLVWAQGVDGAKEFYGYAGSRLTSVTSATGVVRLAAGYADDKVAWVEQEGTGRATIGYGQGFRTVTLATGEVIRQEVDSHGRLVREHLGDSSRHVVYDGDGRPIAQIPGVPDHPMVGYVPPVGGTFFDERGDAVLQIDPLGREAVTEFNNKHKPLTATGPDGATVTYTYGAQGRVTSVTDPRSGVWQVDHNSFGQVTSITDPEGRARSWAFQADGDPATATNEYGGVTTYAVDAHGRVAGVTDPDGVSTSYEFTSWGAPRTITNGSSTTTQAVFDADRRVDYIVDARAKVWDYSYDTLGRLAGVTDPLGNESSFGYDALGRPATREDANQHTYTQTYTVEGWPATTAGPLGSTSTTSYDPAGRPVRVTDALGQVTQTVFNRAGETLRVDTPDGATRSFVYDMAGRPVEYLNARGKKYKSEYFSDGLLKKLTFPDNSVETYTYDGASRPTSVTDRAGRQVTWAYTNQGKTTTESDPVGQRSVTVVSDAGRTISTADGLDRVTTYDYDTAGRVSNVTEPDSSQSWDYLYNAVGKIRLVSDPNGNVTTSTFDDAGRVATITYPDQTSADHGYDAVGNLTSLTDQRGKVWTYDYDALNRLEAARTPLAEETSYDYDPLGRLTKVTDPTGVFTRTDYDPMGNAAVVSDNAQNATVITYDPEANPLTLTDPAGRVITTGYNDLGQATSTAFSGTVLGTILYGYDAAGNLKTRRQDNKTHTYGYDDRDRLVSYTDPTSNTTTMDYDLADQMTAMHYPSGRTTSYTYWPQGWLQQASGPGTSNAHYTYDDKGLLTDVRQPGGQYTRYDYDAMDRVHRQTEPLLRETLFDYDDAGNLTTTTLPSLAQVASTYDDAGREKTRVAGGTTRTYGYDPAGRLTSAATTGAGPNTTVGLTYNTLGQLATSTDLTGTTSYDYDATGRVTGVHPPTGADLTATYNSAGLLDTVRGAVNLNYGYTKSGWVSSRTQQTGTSHATTTFGYDNAGRPTAVSASSSYLNATYDADGLVATSRDNLNSVTNPVEGTTSYTRDDARVDTATHTALVGGAVLSSQDYDWDDNSNRTRLTTTTGSGGGSTTTVDTTPDDAGQIDYTQTGGQQTDYTYNDDGQLETVDAPGTNKDVAYTYDGFGDIDSVTLAQPGGGTATVDYDHDALGRVVQRTQTGAAAGNGTTTYGYPGAGTDPTSTSTGAATTALVYDPAGTLLAAKNTTGQVSHAFTNTRGDLVGWRAQSNGKFTTTTLYDPFGNPTSQPGTGTGPGAEINLGWQGDLTDPLTGLVDMNARAYQPTTGTFTSADTWPGNPGQPVTLNRFLYGNASPPDFTDPTGHWSVAGAASAIVQGISNGLSSAWSTISNLAGGAWTSVSTYAQRQFQSFQQGFTWRAAAENILLPSPFVKWAANQVGLGEFVASYETAVRSALDYLEHHPLDIHTTLDVVGLAPGVGEIADGINGLIYLSAGDVANAMISFAAMIPLVGSFATAGRLARHGDELVGGAKALTRNASDAIGNAGTLARRANTPTTAATTARRVDNVADAGTTARRIDTSPNTAGRRANDGASCTNFRSFGGNTRVLMADGTHKKIKNIRPGDRVLATNPSTAKQTPRRVTATWVHDDDLAVATVAGTRVVTTTDHPFYNARTGRFQPIERFGDRARVLTADGTTRHTGRLEVLKTHRGKAYNLTVAHDHTYHVSTANILVHNTNDATGAGCGPSAANTGAELRGEFSIIDWSGYPTVGGVPRPAGPFRLLEGEEYSAARSAANAANRQLHTDAEGLLKGLQIHEVQPVKFGGSPVDPANKVALDPLDHAKYTVWWNRLQRGLGG